MLKQHVVFECHGAETAKDRRTHEVMRIGAETIDNVCSTIVSKRVHILYERDSSQKLRNRRFLPEEQKSER